MAVTAGRPRRLITAAFVTIVLSLAVHAQQPAPAPTAPPPSPATIEVVQVRAGIYLLAGAGSNVTVQVGPQGVLVVDTMAASMTTPLLAAIGAISNGKPIRYVLNTSADPAHTGGNGAVADAGSQLVAGNFLAQLGAQGAQSAFIVAHENVLNALNTPPAGAPPTPFAALPTDTFFQGRKDMFFNGEAVQLVHVPRAASNGDSLVFFRRSDVISAGDLYANDLYPRIDPARGGHVNGVIEALNTLIDLMVSEQFTEGGTVIVPGHGRLADEIDVVEYRDMVTIVRDRVQAAIDRGLTFAQVQASRPTLDFDRRYGADRGAWTTAMFVDAVYNNLRERATPRPQER